MKPTIDISCNGRAMSLGVKDDIPDDLVEIWEGNRAISGQFLFTELANREMPPLSAYTPCICCNSDTFDKVCDFITTANKLRNVTIFADIFKTSIFGSTI